MDVPTYAQSHDNQIFQLCGLANFLSYVAPLSHRRRAGAPLLSKTVENT